MNSSLLSTAGLSVLQFMLTAISSASLLISVLLFAIFLWFRRKRYLYSSLLALAVSIFLIDQSVIAGIPDAPVLPFISAAALLSALHFGTLLVVELKRNPAGIILKCMPCLIFAGAAAGMFFFSESIIPVTGWSLLIFSVYSFLMSFLSAVKYFIGKKNDGEYIVLFFLPVPACGIFDGINIVFFSGSGIIALAVSLFLFSCILIYAAMNSIYRALMLLQETEKESANQVIYLLKKIHDNEVEIHELSLRDSVTGLRNRRYIYEFVIEQIESFRLSKMLSQDKSFDRRDPALIHKVMGVFLIDIDFFSNVNETFGHKAGDLVLSIIAQELKRIIRKDDTIIRWAGEKYLVLLHKTMPDYIPEFCRKVLKLFRGLKIEPDGETPVFLTCSMGCTLFPFSEVMPQIISFEKCIILCDNGVKRARKLGRNRAVIIRTYPDLYGQGNFEMKMLKFDKKPSIDSSVISLTVIE